MKKERFLSDVKDHQLMVIRDDGVYRHIRLKAPNSFAYQFDLLTWPGHLCYTGDMGTYVFSRLDDMFDFFRWDKINPEYWGEKVLAGDRHSPVEVFDRELFDREVKEYLFTWMREHRNKTTQEERRELYEAVESDVLNADEDHEGYACTQAVWAFSHEVCREVIYGITHKTTFEFTDFLTDRKFTKFSFHYLWACHAIVWGIQRYDDWKTGCWTL